MEGKVKINGILCGMRKDPLLEFLETTMEQASECALLCHSHLNFLIMVVMVVVNRFWVHYHHLLN